MTADMYKGLLEDIVKEINELALRPDNWSESDFDHGYIAGMFVIMKAIQDEIRAFELSSSLIDVDEWFRLGKDYQPNLRL